MDARDRLLGSGALVAGVLSGTSADGIDVACARLRARERDGVLELAPPELLAHACEPFPPELRARVRAVLDGAGLERSGLDGAPCGLREAALLHRDLGRAFGAAARAVAGRSGLALDLVASHGQTVWHHDGVEPSGAATLQLGDGDFVAEACGCAVASDFRQRDVAAGGEGAPLTPLADGLLFPRLPRPGAVLNLGGIGNVTVLGPGDGLLAFDTGPANCLLDGLARRLLGAEMDRDGATAGRGRPSEGLLDELLAHPFLRRPPPKSTGRDTFGAAWVDGVIGRARERGLLERGPADLLATGVELVAASVADALARFAPARVEEVAVAGGGARNPALLTALARRIPAPVRSSAAHGVDPRVREALAFAVLGAATALGLPLSHPGATGAARGRVLGKISPAPGGCSGRPGG